MSCYKKRKDWKRKIPLDDILSRAYRQYKDIEKLDRLLKRKYYNTRPNFKKTK